LPEGCYGTGDIEALFQNRLDISKDPSYSSLKGIEVASHFLIDRAGTITQFVSVNDRAWHAGKSQFEGRDNCNDFSIGVELEGTETTAFADVQYSALVSLTQCLQMAFPMITPNRIVGHSDIAPGRKTDPGVGFDWEGYRQATIETSPHQVLDE